MKNKLWLSQIIPLLIITERVHSQTQTDTAPPIIYQNSLTAPPVVNPAASLPGAPLTTPSGLPGLPSTDKNSLPGLPSTASTTSLPGNPVSTPSVLPGTAPTDKSSLPGSPTSSAPSLLQTVYPQTTPQATAQTTPTQTTSPGLKFNPKPYETHAPPDSYLPGLATIKDRRWIIADFLYNLAHNIGIKVEIIKPEGQYVPLSNRLLEQTIANMFLEAHIEPSALQINCQPPLPMLYVLIMAYPCDKRIVGFISAQLYEEAKPLRINMDLNGVWQTITWERQALVASAVNDFAQEINDTLVEMVSAFTSRYTYYHPKDERECFPRP